LNQLTTKFTAKYISDNSVTVRASGAQVYSLNSGL